MLPQINSIGNCQNHFYVSTVVNSPAHASALFQIMFLMLKYCCYPLISISFQKKNKQEK